MIPDCVGDGIAIELVVLVAVDEVFVGVVVVVPVEETPTQ